MSVDILGHFGVQIAVGHKKWVYSELHRHMWAYPMMHIVTCRSAWEHVAVHSEILRNT